MDKTIERFVVQMLAWRKAGLVDFTLPYLDYVIETLFATAPEWPEGKDAWRSLRIRFSEGRDGVIQTFEAHCAAVKRVHDPEFWRWEFLLSGEHPYQGKSVDRLRLLARNETHRPVVEWIIIPDLSAHRRRNSIASVRSKSSLADEGLALAWLFPERVHAIDYKEWCAWHCAGYESNAPEFDGESWRGVPCVHRHLGDGTTDLAAHWRSDAHSSCSVPSVG